MYIENINGPEDVKKLSEDQLNVLAEEIRDALLKKLSKHGGHFGPNFGMVEATIAMHYVFESPKDKIVYDVSHQSYPHKMLTGRKDAFLYEEHYDDVSGYSNPGESEHDHFTIGHTSTSISLALGLAKARDLKEENGKCNKYRTVVLSDTTAKLVENYLSRYRSYAVEIDPLITNRYQHKIDRDGISYIVKKYADALRKEDAAFPEHVHCHMFRHSKAMHMLEACINIVYIRDFLGHEDISTTMIYVRADNRLKNDAINALAPKVADETNLPDWNKDKDLLQFLNSLK